MKNRIYKLSNGKFISERIYATIKNKLDKLAKGDIAYIAPNVCGIALMELKNKATDSDYVIHEQRVVNILERLGLVNNEGEIDLDVRSVVLCAIKYSPYDTYAMLIDPRINLVGNELDQQANET